MWAPKGYKMNLHTFENFYFIKSEIAAGFFKINFNRLFIGYLPFLIISTIGKQ